MVELFKKTKHLSQCTLLDGFPVTEVNCTCIMVISSVWTVGSDSITSGRTAWQQGPPDQALSLAYGTSSKYSSWLHLTWTWLKKNKANRGVFYKMLEWAFLKAIVWKNNRVWPACILETTKYSWEKLKETKIIGKYTLLMGQKIQYCQDVSSPWIMP